MLIVKGFGAVWPVSEHRFAAVVGLVAALLSGISAIFFEQSYITMPGFPLGAIASVLVSGSAHGGEPFSWIVVALASNFAFYYALDRSALKFLVIKFPHHLGHD
jgi:hypothetical protein